jgi:c-di-GMP phosphodiesterase
MPYSPTFDTTRPRLRLLITLLMFSLPMLLGSLALHSRYQTELLQQSNAAAARTMMLMETMLDHAKEANRKVLPLLGKPCEAALDTLREQVALVPFVRSVNLARQGKIYCTSFFGAFKMPYGVEQYSQGSLLLGNTSPARRDHPFLAMRAKQGDAAVVTLVDGDYLSFILHLSDPSLEIMLNVGGRWLDEQGHFFDKTPLWTGLAQVSLSSETYPLTIRAGHNLSSSWLSLLQYRSFGLILLFSFCVAFAFIMWWLLGRPRSPTNELARALQAREFVPFLQPLVASDSERVMGAEVLMRWQHPTAGLIRPDLFIPQAEASGLIVPMTHLIMTEVGAVMATRQACLPDDFHISFNISAAHCRDDSLLDECRDFLARFAPGKVVLVLELTERELLVADPHTLELFRQLDALGVQLAMDDFGTGHSSLVYLQQFHIDFLKIDQSFIGRIGTESLSEHIVDNVIDLGSRLGLALVAEGVETRQQADYLKGKVACLQGYLFGRPVPVRQFCDEQLADMPEGESDARLRLLEST